MLSEAKYKQNCIIIFIYRHVLFLKCHVDKIRFNLKPSLLTFFGGRLQGDRWGMNPSLPSKWGMAEKSLRITAIHAVFMSQ